MRRPVPSHTDELDLDVRELARAAARRAGLSLEEWAAAILSAQDGRRRPVQEPNPIQNFRAAQDSLSFPQPKPSRSEIERTFETLMAATKAESERQAQDQASRTAIALESMASWIEQTEERLNETARSSAQHHDRMANALSQALATLKDRLDTVERQATAERPAEPDTSWVPAINAISSEIEQLRASMGALATRDEIASLDHALKDIAKDMSQGAASKDLLILAQSTAALYRQIQALSEDMTEGLHGRLGREIDHLKAKIDRMAEAGIDRTVIDFLSSQIVDMRHDLSQRAEPRQIERLSEEVTSLSQQIADLRMNQVGRNDLSALKTSLENVCAALHRTVEAQESSDVPHQLEGMRRNIAELADRPEPAPIDLDPVTDQLALLTERMASLTESRLHQNDALGEMIERLSAQVQQVVEKEAPSQEPLMRRFDTIEEELRQVARQTDIAPMESMLRSIDEKLDRVPLTPIGLDALEQQIASLAERLSQQSDEPLQKVLDEAASQFRRLQDDAADIAERAAKAALQGLSTNLPDASDLDALKQGFVELKALQSRADRKTQETLHAVHGALETLMARLPELGATAQASPATSLEAMPSADRLEAAVRRLHAVTLSQIEDISDPGFRRDEEPDIGSDTPPSMPDLEDADLGTLRANFIAAARRAAQADRTDLDAPLPPLNDDVTIAPENDFAGADETTPSSPASLIARIRQSLEAHRRSLLFGLGFVILATGTVQAISNGLVPSPRTLIETFKSEQEAPVPLAKAQPREEATQTGSIAPAPDKTNLFQPSSLVTSAAPLQVSPPVQVAPKFVVDPATVGEIPTEIPARLRQAALAGDAAAIYEIASQAAEGRDMPRNMILAFHLYERAAQAGLPPAQERLARILEKGIGTTRDLKQAIVWYERAAQGGNIHAMHNLATLLASGSNGKPDYAAALRWYGEAAESGFKDSQFNMGVLLARGIGTKKDLPKAYKWFALAAAQGDEDAAGKRDEIARKLSPSDLAAAKASVEQWHPRPVDRVANEEPVFSMERTAATEQRTTNRT